MLTLFYWNGFRFFFFSNEHKPIHVHVVKGENAAKFNLVPEIEMVNNYGFGNKDLKKDTNRLGKTPSRFYRVMVKTVLMNSDTEADSSIKK